MANHKGCPASAGERVKKLNRRTLPPLNDKNSNSTDLHVRRLVEALKSISRYDANTQSDSRKRRTGSQKVGLIETLIDKAICSRLLNAKNPIEDEANSRHWDGKHSKPVQFHFVGNFDLTFANKNSTLEDNYLSDGEKCFTLTGASNNDKRFTEKTSISEEEEEEDEEDDETDLESELKGQYQSLLNCLSRRWAHRTSLSRSRSKPSRKANSNGKQTRDHQSYELLRRKSKASSATSSDSSDDAFAESPATQITSTVSLPRSEANCHPASRPSTVNDNSNDKSTSAPQVCHAITDAKPFHQSCGSVASCDRPMVRNVTHADKQSGVYKSVQKGFEESQQTNLSSKVQSLLISSTSACNWDAKALKESNPTVPTANIPTDMLQGQDDSQQTIPSSKMHSFTDSPTSASLWDIKPLKDFKPGLPNTDSLTNIQELNKEFQHTEPSGKIQSCMNSPISACSWDIKLLTDCNRAVPKTYTPTNMQSEQDESQQRNLSRNTQSYICLADSPAVASNCSTKSLKDSNAAAIKTYTATNMQSGQDESQHRSISRNTESSLDSPTIASNCNTKSVKDSNVAVHKTYSISNIRNGLDKSEQTNLSRNTESFIGSPTVKSDCDTKSLQGDNPAIPKTFSFTNMQSRQDESLKENLSSNKKSFMDSPTSACNYDTKSLKYCDSAVSRSHSLADMQNGQDESQLRNLSSDVQSFMESPTLASNCDTKSLKRGYVVMNSSVNHTTDVKKERIPTLKNDQQSCQINEQEKPVDFMTQLTPAAKASNKFSMSCHSDQRSQLSTSYPTGDNDPIRDPASHSNSRYVPSPADIEQRLVPRSNETFCPTSGLLNPICSDQKVSHEAYSDIPHIQSYSSDRRSSLHSQTDLTLFKKEPEPPRYTPSGPIAIPTSMCTASNSRVQSGFHTGPSVMNHSSQSQSDDVSNSAFARSPPCHRTDGIPFTRNDDYSPHFPLPDYKLFQRGDQPLQYTQSALMSIPTVGQSPSEYQFDYRPLAADEQNVSKVDPNLQTCLQHRAVTPANQSTDRSYHFYVRPSQQSEDSNINKGASYLPCPMQPKHKASQFAESFTPQIQKVDLSHFMTSQPLHFAKSNFDSYKVSNVFSSRPVQSDYTLNARMHEPAVRNSLRSGQWIYQPHQISSTFPSNPVFDGVSNFTRYKPIKHVGWKFGRYLNDHKFSEHDLSFQSGFKIGSMINKDYQEIRPEYKLYPNTGLTLTQCQPEYEPYFVHRVCPNYFRSNVMHPHTTTTSNFDPPMFRYPHESMKPGKDKFSIDRYFPSHTQLDIMQYANTSYSTKGHSPRRDFVGSELHKQHNQSLQSPLDTRFDSTVAKSDFQHFPLTHNSTAQRELDRSSHSVIEGSPQRLKSDGPLDKVSNYSSQDVLSQLRSCLSSCEPFRKLISDYTPHLPYASQHEIVRETRKDNFNTFETDSKCRSTDFQPQIGLRGKPDDKSYHSYHQTSNEGRRCANESHSQQTISSITSELKNTLSSPSLRAMLNLNDNQSMQNPSDIFSRATSSSETGQDIGSHSSVAIGEQMRDAQCNEFQSSEALGNKESEICVSVDNSYKFASTPLTCCSSVHLDVPSYHGKDFLDSKCYKSNSTTFQWNENIPKSQVDEGNNIPLAFHSI